MAMKHLYRIYPKRALRGIRPQQIAEPTLLENLNRQEFIKCFNGGELYAIVNDEEIHIKECNYEKAEKMFDIEEEQETVEVVMQLASPEANTNSTQYDESLLGKTIEEVTSLNQHNSDVPDIGNENNANESSTSLVEESKEGTDDIATGNSSDEQSTLELETTDGTNAVDPTASLVEESETTDGTNAVDPTASSVEESETTKDDEIQTQDDTKNPSDDQTVVLEKVIEEEADKKEQQPQQYNKNHNNQQNQSNHRNQNNGKHNKGKFVINNQK